MKDNIEQLENQLDSLPKQKRVAVYATLFISIVLASWILISEDMSIELQNQEDSILSLEKDFRKNSIKSLEQEIKKAKKESLILEEKNTEIHFKNQFIQTKLESLGFIFFDEMGIAQLLDKILKNSLEHNIDIKFVESKNKNVVFITHVLEKQSVTVNGSGSFKDIMSLIQYIDSFSALLRIKKISIDIEDDKTVFSLNISHYGVEL
ncbi:MAG: hypothetical protein U9P72_02750 [Campylobacterota bacterium]|nr:hypothetical protein [Campylobacterota bacterium]